MNSTQSSASFEGFGFCVAATLADPLVFRPGNLASGPFSVSPASSSRQNTPALRPIDEIRNRSASPTGEMQDSK